MKTSDEKTATTAQNQVQTERQPFFTREGQAPFFSKTNGASPSFFGPNTVQPKLTVGQPNDKYEVEADAMADKVVQKIGRPANHSPFEGGQGGVVQPKCAECEEEQKLQKKEDILAENISHIQRKPIFESNAEQPEPELQTKSAIQAKCDQCEEEQLQGKADGPSLYAPSGIESRLNTSKGSGNPLSPDIQNTMGSAFGTDFSGVRVHTGANAVQMNKELGAQAFTHGSDIYFNEGKYDTNSTSGKHLLAHELTHTVQQKGVIQQKIQKYPEHECSDGDVINRAQTVVWFEHDSTRLRSDSSVDSTVHLLLLTREVRSYLNMAGASGKITINGYASEEGSPSHNLTLSQQRADRIKTLLVASGISETQITAVGRGESVSYKTRDYNRRAEVTYSPPVTCMEFDPLPIEGNACGAIDCGHTPYALGSRTPHYGTGPDFTHFDFPSLSWGNWLKVAPFRMMPDGLLEFGMKNVLRLLAGSDGVDMVNHFRGGTGSTWTHGIGSRLSREATHCPSVNGAISAIKTQLAAQLRAMQTLGTIDCNAFSLSPVPVFHFSFSDSNALKGIIGGTQGMDVLLTGLSLSDPKACTFEIDIRLVVYDDFGVDDTDLYWPALIKFWILQHERPGNRPFINKLIIERKITI